MARMTVRLSAIDVPDGHVQEHGDGQGLVFILVAPQRHRIGPNSPPPEPRS